ncbi:MAG: VWA domain-containing protein, partial [Gammaproteobacteria bacterium]
MAFAGAGLTMLTLVAGPARAVPIKQLGFLVDSSGSIGSTNFGTMRDGIAAAFNAVLPTDGSVEVTLVRFASGATTVVTPTVIDSAATRTSVASLVSGMGYTGGGTAMSAGINTLTSQITASANYVGTGNNDIIYNIATDGAPNSQSATIAARNEAINIGLDEFDAEFIGNVGTSGYNFLLNSLVYPQPGHQAPPYSPGFVVPVSFANFESAYQSKLSAIVNPSIPEPG